MKCLSFSQLTKTKEEKKKKNYKTKNNRKDKYFVLYLTLATSANDSQLVHKKKLTAFSL